jgi:hypothetical protein
MRNIPLPLPIRVAIGFFVTGKPVKTHINKKPIFFKPLLIVRLQASICLNFILPEFKLNKPYDNVLQKNFFYLI